MLNKLWFTPNGEYIIQFRGSYESKSEIRKLDETAQITLRISVEIA